jgi:S-adenosylmethionine hydrolase
MANPPIITLLTDFGLTDHYTAAMKGVILGICPDARLVDISHEISAFDIEGAAFTLAQAYPCFPAGTVHLIVVDPGVGSERRPILLEAGGHRFVAPDNGVLTFPMFRNDRHTVRRIAAERFFRKPVSHTFHGRDIFAPVAAHVAAGVSPEEFGEQVFDAVRLNIAGPARLGASRWEGKVLRIDHYGNIVTNFDVVSFRPLIDVNSFRMRLGGSQVRQYCDSYAAAPAGLPVLVQGSSGYYEVSINQQNASRTLGIDRDSPIELVLGTDTPSPVLVP